MGALPKLLVLGAVLYFLLGKVDLAGTGHALLNADPTWIALLAATYLCSLAVRSLRLWVLLDRSIPYATVFHAQNVGFLVNGILPMRAGELALTAILRQSSEQSSLTLLSRVFLDRFFDFANTLLFFSLVLVQIPHNVPIAESLLYIFYAMSGISLAVLIFILLAIRREHLLQGLARIILDRLPLDNALWSSRLSNLLQGMNCVSNPRTLFWSSVLSMLIWLITIFVFYCGIRAPGFHTGFLPATLAVCLSVFGLSLVATPSGIGVIHAAIILALGLNGIPRAGALSVALIVHGATTAISFLLGAVGMHFCRLNFRDIRALLRGRKKGNGPTGTPTPLEQSSSPPRAN